MPHFVIERNMPGVGKLGPDELKAASAKSNGVLCDLGPSIEWSHSYVTGDKIYCVYKADDADLIRQHAAQSGFPADRIEEVRAVIDPTTAD